MIEKEAGISVTILYHIDDIRRFLSGNRSDEPEPEVIPLVRSNNDGDVNEDDDDEPLLVLDDESASNRNVYTRNPIGFRLQSILYHFVAEPVVKGRVVIFVIYLFILAGSAVLVSKLQVCYVILICFRICVFIDKVC